MQIKKEKLDIEETLYKKVNNILKFQNIKEKIERGSIISIFKNQYHYLENYIKCTF